MITNEERILIIQSRIDSINISLEWLKNNPSEGPIPEGKMSTEEQILNLLNKKKVLQRVLDEL
jgi:hypothetical protein